MSVGDAVWDLAWGLRPSWIYAPQLYHSRAARAALIRRTVLGGAAAGVQLPGALSSRTCGSLVPICGPKFSP